MFNLYDNSGVSIEVEDIILHENLLTGETSYFLCGKTMLYEYDKYGLFNSKSFSNIKIDNSLSLVNDETSIWTNLGKEAQVYDEIFG